MMFDLKKATGLQPVIKLQPMSHSNTQQWIAVTATSISQSKQTGI
jgi:hypothetical protein